MVAKMMNQGEKMRAYKDVGSTRYPFEMKKKKKKKKNFNPYLIPYTYTYKHTYTQRN